MNSEDPREDEAAETTAEKTIPWDRDLAAFLGSLVVHMSFLLALALAPIAVQSKQVSVVITTPAEELAAPVPEIAEEYAISDRPEINIGANSDQGTLTAMASAEVLDAVSDIPHPAEMPVMSFGQIPVNLEIQQATGSRIDLNHQVRGAAGEGTTGASGAIDRITKDILLSLEQQRTLVVWFFDQSGSLNRQRAEVRGRFDRIYQELGMIEAAGNDAFKKHSDKPLLTSVVAFGQNVQFLLEKPTDSLTEIKAAVDKIEQDTSGVERVFSAVHTAAERFRKYRQETPPRNVMFIVFSDEVGDDSVGLDKTVNLCRRLEIPVYVVGVPAPFGARETLVKYVDPDPSYDQTPAFVAVNQGPESLLPEVVRLRLPGREDPNPMDSGFGPYALTRLCYETGGIYFTVHPNRNVNRTVRRGDVEDFSAHLKHFFDPNIMRQYRPEYVSREEYLRRVTRSKSRSALVRAAELSESGQLEPPNLRFVKADEAAFSNALTEAQKAAAILEPTQSALFEILRQGEADREKESEPRWQAGFDLAMGRVTAARVRAEGYNQMLAAAKRGLKFSDPKNNTWLLEPADDFGSASQLAKAAEQAKKYLDRVVREHPNTPWALLAQLELQTPLGWKWRESFTDITPPRVAAAAPAAPAPAPARPAAAPRPLPKRPPPKL